MSKDKKVEELVNRLMKDDHPDLAYDGSNEPQARELTARERDIIHRIVSEILRYTKLHTDPTAEPPFDKWYAAEIPVYPNEIDNLVAIRSIISPREENRADLWNKDEV